MNWTALIISAILGVNFACASFLLAEILDRLTRWVDQNRKNQSVIPILTFIFGITLISTMLMVNGYKTLPHLAQGMITLILMSTIAYSDVLTGRIPVSLFLISLIFGLYLGVLSDRVSSHLMGGVINLLMGTLIYWLGKKYVQIHPNGDQNQTGFGFGDVYASGAIGVLFGFPLAVISLPLALTLGVFAALLKAIFQKKPFLNMQIRLGPSFLFAAALMWLLWA